MAKPFIVAPEDYVNSLNIVGEHVTVLASGEATERLGASEMFTDIAREVAPGDPDLRTFAEVGGRHGLKLVV